MVFYLKQTKGEILIHCLLIHQYININPFLTNEFTHHCHLEESTVIFKGIRIDFRFLFHFSMKILFANRIAPDGTPRSAASHRGYAVCLCPTKRTPGLYELIQIPKQPLMATKH